MKYIQPLTCDSEPNENLSSVLESSFGEHHAAEIEEVIRPMIADEAFAKATCLLAQVFDGLRLNPKGEAVLHLLGLPFTNGSMHAAALAIGCSPQAIDHHIKSLEPFVRVIRPTTKRVDGERLSRPEACALLDCSDATLVKLVSSKTLATDDSKSFHSYSRADCEKLKEQKLRLNVSWAELMNSRFIADKRKAMVRATRRKQCGKVMAICALP